MILAKLRFGNNSKKPETHPFLGANALQYTDPVNAPSAIEKTTNRRLGFMLGEGKVPDDFNTMGSKEIENLFLNSQGDCVRTYDVPTLKKHALDMAKWRTI